MLLTVKEQLDHLDSKISHYESEIRIFERLKERLQDAETNPKGIIVHPYDSNHPEAIFIGDNVMTKYGNEGDIVKVNHEKRSFSIRISSEWEKDRIGEVE